MTPPTRLPLLSEQAYDEDAGSIDSDPATDSNSDAEESYVQSQVPNQNDRRILEDADQEENLLRRPGRMPKVRELFSTRPGPEQRSKRRHERRAQRHKDEAEGSGNTGLIYEMEGGYKDNSSRSSSESLELSDEKWNKNSPSQRSIVRNLLIAIGLSMLFGFLVYGSYTASSHRLNSKTYSNGTHTFGPTTILVSLDGFRADFLHRGLTPAMKAFVESGISPRYMLPSFPSLTFPNHFTLVTGLYPESHGIVSNQFWDPVLKEEFYYTDTDNSMQPKWWNAEPLWVTAEKAGLKTAIHMWPGSEAHIDNLDPTYLDKYNGSEALDVKVNRVLGWLDLPRDRRPQFIGAYVPNVDADGHKYGPNSTQIRATIAEVDSMLTSLIEGLFERNLTEIVNLVVVSDHGMATTSDDRLIQLDDFIDMSLVDHIDGWPLRGLRLKQPDRDVSILHQQLLEASKTRNFDVYTLDTMPERYHFSKNDRIAPLWVVPEAGWIVIEKDDFDIAEAKATGKQYHPFGLHGYDHEHPLMRAIFIARGPAFPHSPNSRVAAFQNIEVYNIVCDSLSITPHPNNGTLRLPLKTEGLHSDFNEDDSLLDDPVSSSAKNQPQTSPASVTDVIGSPTRVAPVSTTPEQTDVATEEQGPTPTDESVKAQDKHSSWWDFLHNQIGKAKEWAKELIESIRNNEPSKDRTPV